MQTDPLVFGPISTLTFGTSANYNRTGDGIYLKEGTTVDEPTWLTLQNTLNPSGVSSFVAKLQYSKNVPGSPSYGAQPVPDDVSSIHVVVRQAHRAHTAANMATFRDELCGFLLGPARWDKFLRGEK